MPGMMKIAVAASSVMALRYTVKHGCLRPVKNPSLFEPPPSLSPPPPPVLGRRQHYASLLSLSEAGGGGRRKGGGRREEKKRNEADNEPFVQSSSPPSADFGTGTTGVTTGLVVGDELVHACRASNIAYLRPQVALPRLRRLFRSDEEEDDEVDIRFYDSARDGPDSPLLDEREHAQAYMWIDARRATAYVAFRGTRGIADLMADADLRTERLAPFPQAPLSSSSSSCSASSLSTSAGRRGLRAPVYVHKGFQDQFCAVERKLTADLAACSDRFDRLVVTGHSLGGALATLAAVVYADDERIVRGKREEPKEVWCYTFGCPRVGDEAFVELFQERIPPRRAWRVFDYADPVPMVPLSPRYAHVEGSGVRLGEEADEGEVDIYCPSCVDVPWPLRLPAGLCALELPNPIAPHACDRYVRKVEALRELLPSRATSG